MPLILRPFQCRTRNQAVLNAMIFLACCFLTVGALLVVVTAVLRLVFQDLRGFWLLVPGAAITLFVVVGLTLLGAWVSGCSFDCAERQRQELMAARGLPRSVAFAILADYWSGPPTSAAAIRRERAIRGYLSTVTVQREESQPGAPDVEMQGWDDDAEV